MLTSSTSASQKRMNCLFDTYLECEDIALKIGDTDSTDNDFILARNRSPDAKPQKFPMKRVDMPSICIYNRMNARIQLDTTQSTAT